MQHLCMQAYRNAFAPLHNVALPLSHEHFPADLQIPFFSHFADSQNFNSISALVLSTETVIEYLVKMPAKPKAMKLEGPFRKATQQHNNNSSIASALLQLIEPRSHHHRHVLSRRFPKLFARKANSMRVVASSVFLNYVVQ